MTGRENTFDRFQAEAGLCGLKEILEEIRHLLRQDIAFTKYNREGQRYVELMQAYQAIIEALLPIKSWTCRIGQVQFDGLKIGGSGPELQAGEGIDDISQHIKECRTRLIQARRELTSEHLVRLVNVVDRMLERIIERMGPDTDAYDDEEWEELGDVFSQIQRLTSNIIPRAGHWSDMLRHLTSGQKADLRDIVDLDWPSIRREIELNSYGYSASARQGRPADRSAQKL